VASPLSRVLAAASCRRFPVARLSSAKPAPASLVF
jgi:hypothetical protein